MEKKHLTIIGILCGLLSIFIVAGFLISNQRLQPKLLTISFLDVGQGDSIFIQTPSGHQILVDGGVNDKVLSELGTIMQPGDHSIDLVIATHPDADHISGLVSVIQKYDLENFMDPGYPSDTHVYQQLIDTVSEHVPNHVYGQIGDRIDAGDGVTLDLLAPYTLDTTETNDASIVTKLTYGNESVMLTGDAPIIIEQHLVKWYGNQLHSQILKAGHHGSKTSSSPSWITAGAPDIGIISAGKNNRYGHPHRQVLDILNKANVQILGTYEEGTITFQSDGVNLWRK